MLAINTMTPTTNIPEKNFGFSHSDFIVFLAQLQNGEETLLDQIVPKHVKNCVAFLISSRGCSYEMAYDCAIDALMEIRVDLLRNKLVYGNLESYFTNRAGRIFYKRTQSLGVIPLVSIENVEMENEYRTEAEIIEAEFKELVKQALKKLCPECRKILKWFYYDEVPFKKIATWLNLKHNTVLQKATRCRNKLRDLLGERFYQQFKPYFK